MTDPMDLTTEPRTFSASIEIAATPSAVYAVVSDVTRTGEWSPVCRDCWWDEGDGPWVGARFTGRNVTPDRTWETRCEVVHAVEGVAFGWAVNGGLVRWGYTMTATPVGTLLTESWEFTTRGLRFFVDKHGDQAPATIEARTRAAHEGIPATLAAIKTVVEGSAPSASRSS